MIDYKQGWVMIFCAPRLMKLCPHPQTEARSNSPAPVMNIFLLVICFSSYIWKSFSRVPQAWGAI